MKILRQNCRYSILDAVIINRHKISIVFPVEQQKIKVIYLDMRIFKLKSILQFLIFVAAAFIVSLITIDNNAWSDVNKELSELQEILFKPEKSQLAVLLTVTAPSGFKLNFVNLYLDNRKTKTYIYSQRESKALLKNATQKIYVGNLSEGEHTIKAEFSAIGGNKQSYEISSSSKLTKTDTTKFVELEISKSEQQDLPVLNIKIWE
ncbi:MAG: hypothetical protein ACC653_01860 [Gammaproteobacteria bacterium]